MNTNLIVEKEVQEGSCSMCTSRELPTFRLSSTSPARPMVLLFCKRCAWQLSQQLNELGA